MKLRKLTALSISLLMSVGSFNSVHAASIDDTLSDMTLTQKIAQMIMVDIRTWGGKNFTQMNTTVSDYLKKYDFGGVVLFQSNFVNNKQTLTLTKAMQSAALSSSAKIPMLIATDQEGGTVRRITQGCAMPGNMAVAATGQTDNAKEEASIMASELKALGVNTNLAPVADVNSNPNNPAIGLRSFSDDPTTVAKYTQAFVNGTKSQGEIACLKHFPGHGETTTDSHTGLATVNKSYAAMKKTELVPYTALAKKVDLIMSGHIAYPQVDSTRVLSRSGSYVNLPATLSKKLINNVLRKDLGYTGVVMTDSLVMGAITNNFTAADACIRAINAGNDLLCMPVEISSSADMTKLDNVIMQIESAVNRGTIATSRINESVRRILKLKQKYKILNYQADTLTLTKANQTVGSQAHHNTEDKMAAQAVTVTKNQDQVLPIKVKKGQHVLMMTPYDNELPGLALGFKRAMNKKAIVSGVTYETYKYTSATTESYLRSIIQKSDIVICVSELTASSQMASANIVTRLPNQAMTIAKQLGKKRVILSIARPYDVQSYANAQGVAAVYGNAGMDPTESLTPATNYGPNIVAGVEVLFGLYGAAGKLPVNIYKYNSATGSFGQSIVYKRGYGLTYKGLISYQNNKKTAQKSATVMNAEAVANGKANRILMMTVAIGVIAGILLVLFVLKFA